MAVNTPPMVNPVNVPPRIAPGIKEIKLSFGIYPAFDTILNTAKNIQAPRMMVNLFLEKTVTRPAAKYAHPINQSIPHH